MKERGGRRPPLTVEGEQVALGPLRRDLIPTYARWHNDVATTRTYVLSQPATLEQEEAAYTELTTDLNKVFFTVYERATWRAVGTAYLTDIDHFNRCAEFGILIGEARDRGLGYGTETTNLMLDFAFTALRLHNVMLTVDEHNLAGRRAYAKAGFREAGRRRRRHWLGGRWWDEILMDCLESEFTSLRIGRLVTPEAP